MPRLALRATLCQSTLLTAAGLLMMPFPPPCDTVRLPDRKTSLSRPQLIPRLKHSLFAGMTAQLISCYMCSRPALYPPSLPAPPNSRFPPQQLQSCATPNYSQQCQAGGAAVTADGSGAQSLTAAAAAGGQSRKGHITVSVMTVIYLKSGRRQSVLCLCLFLPSVATEPIPENTAQACYALVKHCFKH